MAVNRTGSLFPFLLFASNVDFVPVLPTFARPLSLERGDNKLDWGEFMLIPIGYGGFC